MLDAYTIVASAETCFFVESLEHSVCAATGAHAPHKPDGSSDLGRGMCSTSL
jgi:hypothetical protein